MTAPRKPSGPEEGSTASEGGKTGGGLLHFGEKWGPFWWNYNLSAGSRFIDRLPSGWELRWWGITFGNVGIGIMLRVRKEQP